MHGVAVHSPKVEGDPLTMDEGHRLGTGAKGRARRDCRTHLNPVRWIACGGPDQGHFHLVETKRLCAMFYACIIVPPRGTFSAPTPSTQLSQRPGRGFPGLPTSDLGRAGWYKIWPPLSSQAAQRPGRGFPGFPRSSQNVQLGGLGGAWDGSIPGTPTRGVCVPGRGGPVGRRVVECSSSILGRARAIRPPNGARGTPVRSWRVGRCGWR